MILLIYGGDYMFIDGVKLTQIRVWRNLTRAQLADITGIPESKIMRFEKVTHIDISGADLNAIYEALNINYNNIRYGG